MLLHLCTYLSRIHTACGNSEEGITMGTPNSRGSRGGRDLSEFAPLINELEF
jgi:hypothetical protein